jgi:hypothetical protein
MAKPNMLLIFLHKAVRRMPSPPARPSLLNSHDVGIAVDVRMQDLGFAW